MESLPPSEDLPTLDLSALAAFEQQAGFGQPSQAPQDPTVLAGEGTTGNGNMIALDDARRSEEAPARGTLQKLKVCVNSLAMEIELYGNPPVPL